MSDLENIGVIDGWVIYNYKWMIMNVFIVRQHTVLGSPWRLKDLME